MNFLLISEFAEVLDFLISKISIVDPLPKNKSGFHIDYVFDLYNLCCKVSCKCYFDFCSVTNFLKFFLSVCLMMADRKLKAAKAAFDTSLDNGITFIDTAEVYGSRVRIIAFDFFPLSSCRY